jgi:hypothetical protein
VRFLAHLAENVNQRVKIVLGTAQGRNSITQTCHKGNDFDWSRKPKASSFWVLASRPVKFKGGGGGKLGQLLYHVVGSAGTAQEGFKLKW